MQFFLLGLVVLVAVLLLLRGFTRANAAAMARQLRLYGGVLALTGAGLLVVRGYVSYGMPLGMLGWWLIWGGGHGWRGGGSKPAAHKVTRIETDYLEMELDHDSGSMHGRVLRGEFAGREIEAMSPAELARLWQDCAFSDPRSAQILEAYLDRMHPSWRDDMARATRHPGGPMSATEAYEILGLSAGADADEIRRAHRELMLKCHPDRGGSTYLAAKLNEAKEVLLGRE